MASDKITLANRVQNLAALMVLRGALLIPYRARVPFVGWVMSALVAPLSGWRKRIRDNLALALPDLQPSEVERIVRAVPDNAGRTLIEIYSGEAFVSQAMNTPQSGPGLEALHSARKANKPVILLTAHFGNYDAIRGALVRQGFPMAALYKPMRNTGFNKHYVEAISAIAEPVFPTNKKGLFALAKHLRDGGIIGIVGDVAKLGAPVQSFFDQPSHTPQTAAEWALKFNAALIPVYGRRKSDGLSFEIFFDEPIPASSPEEMMQTYNDSVEAIARKYPDQWFWVHRRWKLHDHRVLDSQKD
ncbi:MAG: lauroyl acyltransferase [Boseongicola sp.]|nr:MAG: lauroyl acyltransferase [Boseongicola sp.]